MPTTTATYGSAHLRSRFTSRTAALVTVLVPVATAATIVAVMHSTASPVETLSDVATTAGFYAWNLAPVAGATLVLLWAGRRGWWPYAAAALGCVGLALLTFSALRDFWTSDSSTSALIFLFLPLMQWSAVAVTVGLVALAAWKQRRVNR